MSKVWSDFYDYIAPEIPGWDQPLMDLVIRKTVLDFYDDCGILVVDHAPITTTANSTTYTFVPPTGYDVARPHTCWYLGNEIRARGEAELNKQYTQWTQQLGTPAFYMCEDQNSLRLVPCPDTNAAGTGALTLRVVLKPARTATGIAEDWVFNRWVDAISWGVKAELMAMPAKPWTNPQLAAYYADKYRVEKDNTIRDMNKSLTRARAVVRMNPAA